MNRRKSSKSFSVTTVHDGTDAVTYEVESTVGTLTIPSQSTSAQLNCTLRFWQRVGTAARTAYSCYSWVFVRKGTDYTRVLLPGSKSDTRTVSITSTAASTYLTAAYDAVVVFIHSDAAAFDWRGPYLAKLEIPIVKNGDKGQQGEQGERGDDAVAYSLMPSSAQFVYDPYDDSITPQDFGLKVLRTEGSSPTVLTWAQMTGYGLTLQYRDNGGSWQTVDQSTFDALRGGTQNAFQWFMTDYITTEDFQLLRSGTAVATATVSVTSNGEEGPRGPQGPTGPQGKTGPMAYLTGDYDATVDYGALRTDTRCPVVHFRDGTSDQYWYPTDGYRGAGYAPSTANGWAQAERFEMVVTKILFTQFAKLGGFVVSGDFMLSQYGELFDADGNRLALTEQTDSDGSTHWRYQGVDAYTYFRDYDPMAEYGVIPSIETRVGVNQQYWNYYETTADEFYMPVQTTERTTANANRLKQLTAGDYYLFGVDASGVQHCLLIRVTRYVSSNARLYGYREKHIGPYVPAVYSTTERIFRPVKLANAATGEEWMAGGKVHVGADGNVSVEGTVKAQNLYRNLCLFSNGVYSTEVFYISSLNDWSRAKGYAVGDYIIGRPDANAEPDFSSVGMVLCSYDADIIQMVPTSNNSWDSSNPLRLPAPKDFPGKVVEITGWSRTTSEVNMYVGSVMGSVSSMCLAVEVSGGKFVPAETATVIAIKTGTTTRFMSMMLNGNYYWTKLNEK